MKKRLIALTVVALATVTFGAGQAQAWSASGYVYCDANGNGQPDANIDTPLAGVPVSITGSGFTGSATTDAAGFYSINLPDVPGTYQIGVTPPNGAAVLVPSANPYTATTTDLTRHVELHFLLAQGACAPPPPPPPPADKCWLTGGGAKFSAVTNTNLAEHGPQHSFGGNVNPGCNADSGDGGQWNHIAHALKLHFQGWVVEIVRCGNVTEIPPGSTSPVTPYNFIEFRGTGTLKGIRGNQVDHGTVTFFARAEDRNEPGSTGQRDGAYKDRYFLHVWDTGLVTRLLIDVDGDPNTVDPVTITDGNLQLHISSCSTP